MIIGIFQEKSEGRYETLRKRKDNTFTRFEIQFNTKQLYDTGIYYNGTISEYIHREHSVVGKSYIELIYE